MSAHRLIYVTLHEMINKIFEIIVHFAFLGFNNQITSVLCYERTNLLSLITHMYVSNSVDVE